MNNLIPTNLNSIILVLAITLVVFLGLVTLFLRKRKPLETHDKFEELYEKISTDIKYAVSPKFVELSLGVNDLVDLAVEVWDHTQYHWSSHSTHTTLQS